MRAFFTRTWLCCTNPSSYKELKGKPFWSGFWYLYWLIVVMTFLAAVIFATQATVFLPQIQEWIGQAKQTVPDLYPAELTLTFSGGQLFTNVEEPYIFPLPSAWEEAIRAEAGEDDESPRTRHLLVIDTSATAEQYSEYETAALLTKNAAVARDDNTLKVVLYSEFQQEGAPPIVMNRAVYDEVMSKALPFLDYVPSIVIGAAVAMLLLLPWFAAGVGVLGYLLYLLVFTLLAWVIAAIMGRKFTYRDLYCLGLYALTPAIVLEWILERLDFETPMVFTAVFLVMMGCVIRVFSKDGSVTSARSSRKPAKTKA